MVRILNGIGAIAGALLLIGLWTPVASGSVALLQLSIYLSGPRLEHPFGHAYIGVLGVALALLGPGAWSIDSRLFGRKLYVYERPSRANRQPL